MNKINEKELLKTPVFTVVEKEFEGTSFKPVGLNCPEWVMVIVIDKNRKTLVVRQTRWGLENKTIEWPCGTVEKGEEPKVAAVRELQEETGFKDVDPDRLSLLGEYNPNPAHNNNLMHAYLYSIPEMPKEFGELNLDENEDCEPSVVDIDNDDLQNALLRNAMSGAAMALLYRRGIITPPNINYL